MEKSNEEILNNAENFVKLADVSERDKVWDIHKNDNVSVNEIYGKNEEFTSFAVRLSQCSGKLYFSENIDTETGEVKINLKKAKFCRVRTCPICQWRRSLMWKAKFHQSLPKIKENYPNVTFIFLTLTVRNCEITELRSQLNHMHKSFRKMMKYEKIQKAFLGWVRTTEVTRGSNGSAHPHYHCLIMVRKTYSKSRDYITHKEFVEMWQRACKLDYLPNVDVRAVKSKKDGSDNIENAISETLKYSVKPSDLTEDPTWLYEYTRQVKKLRFIDTGGALKDVFKEDDKGEDLIHFNGKETNEEEENMVSFSWIKKHRFYAKRKNDK